MFHANEMIPLTVEEETNNHSHSHSQLESDWSEQLS